MSGPPPSFLTSPELRLILFGGKGGVGKTTCATAAALRLARQSPDRPVALLSTDPAHSLRDSLADARVPWNLEVVELRAQEGLDDFRRRHGRQLEAIAERGTFLDSEDIHRFLSLSLPGMDELFAFLDIARRAERPGGDACTVVDTAPTGHTLRLLAMPELLRGWVNVLDTLLAKHRYMRQLFGRAPAPDELDRFLMELADSVAAAEGLLTDGARCRFVPVMIAEELSVRETATLLGELERQRLASSEVVVNQLSPGSECALCAGTRSQQLALLGRLPAAFQGRALFGVPLQPREVRGEAALGSFWDEAERLRPERAEPRPPGPSPPEIPAPPRLAEDPAPPPSPALKLVFFAGKGGVGKTTLACATALRLARGSPGSRILLFSTDPAHSVGDCLDLAVGPEPRPVVAGLAALEIDARADFEALKGEYRREIDAFFGSLLRNLDAPFDRAVMKQIIELSPPGLDEVMALTRAMDLLLERRYDLLVLDTAPTGHLVRLLEMPQLVSDWLKAFFGSCSSTGTCSACRSSPSGWSGSPRTCTASARCCATRGRPTSTRWPCPPSWRSRDRGSAGRLPAHGPGGAGPLRQQDDPTERLLVLRGAGPRGAADRGEIRRGVRGPSDAGVPPAGAARARAARGAGLGALSHGRPRRG
jgi:arsenite-transporting ATPase